MAIRCIDNGNNIVSIFLIIDAMDILHSGSVDGFCIVSSDSDFTGLAKRIREQGMFVMGIGRMITSASFQRHVRSLRSLKSSQSIQKRQSYWRGVRTARLLPHQALAAACLPNPMKARFCRCRTGRKPY